MGKNRRNPDPVAQSGGIVSDITLSRQRENIAGLEVEAGTEFTMKGRFGRLIRPGIGTAREVAVRRNRLRRRATIRRDRPHPPSNKGAPRGRRASKGNRLILACNL